MPKPDPQAQLRPDGLTVCFPRWQANGLVHGITTRAALPEEGKDDLFRVIVRARAIAALPTTLTVGADQVHGENLEIISKTWMEGLGWPDGLRLNVTHALAELPAIDALITTRSGVLIVIQTADCLPVFLLDRERQVAGLAHCGWRGLRLGLAGKTAREMVARGAQAEALEAWLGPCIQPARYEVGRQLVDEFAAAFPGAPVSPNGTHLDLPAIARWQLEQAGLAPERIIESGECTLGQQDRYHSYRGANEHAGRMLSFIGFQ